MTLIPNKPARASSLWRPLGWGLAAMLLILPLAAGQLTDDVDWDLYDFLVFGALLVAAGLAFEILARRSQDWRYRLGAATAVAAGCGTILTNAAVGIIGPEHAPINLGFYVVPLLALVGALIARFRSTGMAIAMAIAAVGYLSLVMVGLLIGAPVTFFVVGPAVVWIASAELFRRAGPIS